MLHLVVIFCLLDINNQVCIVWMQIQHTNSPSTFTLPITMDILAFGGLDSSYSANVGHPSVQSFTKTIITCRFNEGGRIIIIGT